MKTLYVSLRVDALLLDEPLQVDGPDVDLMRLGDLEAAVAPNPAQVGSPPMAPHSEYLAPGVHLHWALPDGLMRGVSHKRPWAPFQIGGLWFPALPNRWLILRDNGVPLVIESDHEQGLAEGDGPAMVHPVTGELMRLGRARPVAVGGTPDANDLFVLTALGPAPRDAGGAARADPAFTALQANCRGVFTHYDPYPIANGRYRVVGWYAAPEDDPLAVLSRHLQDDPAAMDEPLARPNTEAEMSAEERRNAHAAWLGRVFGWIDEAAGDGDALPDQIMCFGEVRPEAPADVPDTAAPLTIAVGHTGTEALSAWLADDQCDGDSAKRPAIEAQLEGFGLRDRLDAFAADLPHRFDEERHARRFQTAPTPPRYALRPVGHDASPIADVPAWIADAVSALNAAAERRDAAQLALDRTRKNLALDWQTWMAVRYTPLVFLSASARRTDVNGLAALIADGLETVETARRAQLSAIAEFEAARDVMNGALAGTTGWEVTEVPGPLFQQTRDPVVVLAGPLVQPSLRHLKDGAAHSEGLHRCRSVARPGAEPFHDMDRPDGAKRVASYLAGDGADLIARSAADSQRWHPFRAEWEARYTPYRDTEEMLGLDANYKRTIWGLSSITLWEGAFHLDRSGGHVEGRDMQGVHEFGPGRRGWPNVSHTVIRITGRSHLGDHVAPILESALARFREQKPDVIARGETGALLTRAAGRATEARPQSFSLSGLVEAISGRAEIPRVAIADPAGSHETQALTDRVAAAVGGWIDRASRSDQPFLPVIGGVLDIDRIRIVDNFGRARWMTPERVVTADGLEHLGARTLRLPPRLAQPARLRAEWVSSADPEQPTADHPSTGPILGWLAVNHLDPGRVAVHDAGGEPLGLMDRDGRWHPTPGRADAPQRAQDIADPDLARRITWLTTRPDGAAFAAAFAETVDRSLDAAHPPDLDDESARALIMGRPIAILRCRIWLELFGPPDQSRAWRDLQRRIEGYAPYDMNVENLWVPIAPGAFGRAGDGVVGYWIESAPGANAAGVDPSPFKHGLFTLLPEGPPRINGFARQRNDEMLHVSAGGGPVTLTVLLDPRAAMHLRSGVLPTVSLGLDNIHFRAAMGRVGITHPVTPLVTHPGQIEMPLPALGAGSWSWVEPLGDDWRVTAAEPHVTREAVLQAWPGTGPQMWERLLDAGWLIEEGNEAGARIAAPEAKDRKPLTDVGDPLLVATVLERIATRIAPPLHTPRFDRPMELREGWLRFRPDPTTDADPSRGDG